MRLLPPHLPESIAEDSIGFARSAMHTASDFHAFECSVWSPDSSDFPWWYPVEVASRSPLSLIRPKARLGPINPTGQCPIRPIESRETTMKPKIQHLQIGWQTISGESFRIQFC